MSTIRLLQGQVKEYDKAIEKQLYAIPNNQSGDFLSDETHLIKSGNHHLRYYLCEAANSLRKCDPEFRRFYNLKFREVTKHQHRRALALTTRKLVRLVYALLKTNRLYIPPEE